MTNIVVDAYTWIHYCRDGKYAEIIETYLLKNTCFTSSITVAESVSKVLREGESPRPLIEAIHALSQAVPFDEALAEETGRFHTSMRKKRKHFGLADAALYCTAKGLKARILTNDHHFAEFKETILLEKEK